MIVWQGFHHDKKIPILISVEYDEESEVYVVEVTRGTDSNYKTFSPKYKPKDGLMHISDVEKSVKLANVIVKELKQLAIRSK